MARVREVIFSSIASGSMVQVLFSTSTKTGVAPQWTTVLADAGEQGDAFPVTTWLSTHGLSLPTSNDIQLEDVDRVCDAITQIVGDGRLIHHHLKP